ncbi:HAD-IA family hydrolase [Paenibacillus sp. M.A.Huq-81]
MAENKHIVFDFDGTLVDSIEAIVLSYNDLADLYRFQKINRDDYPVFIRLPIRERLKVLGVQLHRFLLFRKLTKQFKVQYRQHLGGIVFYDGMLDVLLELKARGYVLSIISSNAETNIRLFLEQNEVNLFDHVIESNGLFGKHQTIKQYMRKHRVSSRDMVYLGDEVRDIEACRKMGVKIIAVAWGLDHEDLLKGEKPDCLIHRPLDILSNI